MTCLVVADNRQMRQRVMQAGLIWRYKELLDEQP
jgi:hypothetical protein